MQHPHDRHLRTRHRVLTQASERRSGALDVRCGVCGPLAYGAGERAAAELASDHEQHWSLHPVTAR